MLQVQVTLLNGVVADLHYGHDYPGGVFDYIQLSRTNSLFKKQTVRQIEEAYWADLEKNRTKFASQVPAAFDLIVRAPSNSGWHLPFVAAVCRTHPTIQCLDFIKDPDDPSIVRAFNDKTPGLAQATRVLIVDDVFGKGTIATKVVEKLHQYGLNMNVPFMIACPLRIPPFATISASALQAAIAGMGGAP